MNRRRHDQTTAPARTHGHRLATVAVVVAAVLGGWGAVSAIRASSELESSSRALASHQAGRAALREHRTALERYALDAARADALVIARSGLRLREAVSFASESAGGEGGAAEVANLHRRYADATAVVVSRVRAGALARARDANAAQAQPAAEMLDRRLAAAVAASRASVLQEAAAERRIERLALAGAPLLLALALGAGLASALFGSRGAEKLELRRLTEAAFTDSLTGLGNRRAFDEDVAGLIRQRTASGTAISLMMLDLDGLKQINDTLGHHAGDARIKEVGQLLRSIVRESDSAYRTGGDEFIVLLPDERAWGALNLAQRLQELAAEGRSSVTVGIAETTGLEAKETFVHHADLALYEAKRSGRKVVVYSPELERVPHSAESRRTGRPSAMATALVRALDAKDATTRAHCETVSELCGLIGHELGLDAPHVGQIRLAGLLHDVGKIGIPDAVLQKDSSLEGGESDLVRTHPIVGESIVEAAGLVEEAWWVRCHHERLDGSGYPAGLRGGAIPLEARIIAVADVFDAMTSDRPHRRARSAAEALEELEQRTGTAYDAECVAALRRIVVGVTGSPDARLAA